MSNKQIEFILSLRDGLTAKWNAVTSGMVNGIKNLAKTFQANWAIMSASAYAAFAAIKTGFDWMEGWAKGEVMAGAFRATLKRMGMDADVEFEKIKTAAAGMIDDDTLTEMSNRWLSMGMDIRQMSDVLQLARIKARETGTDMQEAFTRLSEALSLGKERGLKALGIAVDTTDAYKKYASTLGITTAQLTDLQKKQAVMNAALEAGKKAAEGMDLSTKTLNEKISTYKAKIEEMKDFGGQVFYRLMMLLYGSIQAVWSALLQVGAAFAQLFSAIGSAADRVGLPIGHTFRKIAESAQLAADDAKKSMNDTFDLMVSRFRDDEAASPIISATEDVIRATADMYNREKQAEETSAAKSVKLLSETLDKKKQIVREFLDTLKVTGVEQYEFSRGLTEKMEQELADRMDSIQTVMSGMLSTLQSTFSAVFSGDAIMGVRNFMKGVLLVIIDTVQAYIMAAAAMAWAKGVMTFGFSTWSDLPLIAAATVGLQALRGLVSEKFHSGGVVPGSGTYVNAPANQERLVMVRGGETIRTESQERELQGSMGGRGVNLSVNVYGPIADDVAFKNIVQDGMRKLGITDVADYFRNNRSNLVLQA